MAEPGDDVRITKLLCASLTLSMSSSSCRNWRLSDVTALGVSLETGEGISGAWSDDDDDG